jgi:DNA-binding NarL/FixJ family response regulator
LIVLDIGLPVLNGIEAATRISQVSHGSKVIFLTLESNADVAKVALSNGALAYVLKCDAAMELLPAIEAVLRGERFVSDGLKE